MTKFVECVDCGFVLYASDPSEPNPEGRDDCPDCGGADFEFTAE